MVEELHPSKAILYSEEIGWIGTVNFSEVQVVVLSEKQQSSLEYIQMVKRQAM